MGVCYLFSILSYPLYIPPPSDSVVTLDTFFPLELILDIRISGEGLPMATMAYLVRRMMM